MKNIFKITAIFIFLSSGANAAQLVLTSADHTLTDNSAYDGGTAGIIFNSSVTNRVLNLDGFTISASNNTAQGFQLTGGGVVTVNGNGGAINLTDNRNAAGTSGTGLNLTGATTLNINNADVNISGSVLGISNAAGSKLNFIGGGTNTINSSNNKNATTTGGTGILSTGAGSEVSITDYQNIIFNGNTNIGMQAASGGSITITGKADGTTTFTASGNGRQDGSGNLTAGQGIYISTAGSAVTMTNMQSVDINGNYTGVQNVASTNLTLSGNGSATSSLSISNNTYTGLINSGSTDISGFSTININNNGNIGVSVTGASASLDISGVETMNVNGNASGITTAANTTLNLTGTGSAASKLSVNNNTGTGFSSAGLVTIKDFREIEASGNGGNGFVISGASTIETAAGQNLTIKTNNNTSVGTFGFLSTAANLVLDRVDIFESTGNGRYGFAVNNGKTTMNLTDNGVVTLDGNGVSATAAAAGLLVNGATAELEINGGLNSTLSASGNKNSTGSGGVGIQAASGSLKLNNMETITAEGNITGISTSANGSLLLDGSGSLTSKLSVNNNIGAGISAAQSTSFTIQDFAIIEANGNGGTGLNLGVNSTITNIAGEQISISSSNNTGAASDGIYSSAANLELKDLASLQLNNNGRYGLHVYSGSVSIDAAGRVFGVGDLSVTGNGNHGVYLRLDNLEIANVDGINISGNGGTGMLASGGTLSLKSNNTEGKMIFSNNGGDGAKFTGSTQLINFTQINAFNNGGTGFSLAGNIDWQTQVDSEFSFVAKDNGASGIVLNGSSLEDPLVFNVKELVLTNNGTKVTSNSGTGLSLGRNITFNVTDTDITATDNGAIGLYVSGGGVLNAISSTGTNIIRLRNNGDKSLSGSSMGMDVHGGRFYAENMNVINIENQNFGIIAWYNGEAIMKDSNIIVTDNANGILASRATIDINSTSGLHTIYGSGNTYALITQENAQYEGSEYFNITNMDIYLENNSYAIASTFGGGAMNIKGNGSNILSFKDNLQSGLFAQWNVNRPSAGTKVALSQVNVEGMYIQTENDDLAIAESSQEGGAEINIKDSTINMLTQDTLFQTIGYGVYNIENVTATGNSALLVNTAIADHNDPSVMVGKSEFNAKDAFLSGVITTAADTAAHVSFTDSAWNMINSSNMTSLTNSSSDIFIGSQTSGAYNTLTLENYMGHNGNIYLNTDVNGGSTDMISVSGSANGSTTLFINDTSTTLPGTDPLEIKIVEAKAGAHISANSFVLNGGSIDTGAFKYFLLQGNKDQSDNQSFFLRLSNAMTDTFKTMLNIPQLNVVMAQTGMNSLQKRLGDLRNFGNSSKQHGVWTRSYGKQITVDDLIETDMSIFGFEAGYDFLMREGDENRIYLGLMGGYMTAGNVKTKQDNGFYSKGNGDAPSVGAYMTFITPSSYFLDLTIRNFWTNLDMVNYSSLGTELKYSPRRNLFTMSAEFGKEFQIMSCRGTQWRVEPKAELAFLNASGDSTNVENGNGSLKYENASYIITKASVMLAYMHKRQTGLFTQPYAELAYSQTFMGKGDVSYSGAVSETNLSGGAFETALGLNYQFNKDIYVYGQATFETGSKIQAFGGNLGFRLAF
ncbi:outer membrane autotransporter barrel domain protein [Elusimicrobium minutum Pei191]|uniref:Outer membrane autotransporter barrel domain protein n=1 Tax=Elusimicrobium minutum (strain Pei191) TaxID=445932 RepID=B2KB70_ELUMP|nr:autotransporter domain-containing protein [Elusimicrobium minutum]ACC97892.1 outer membrane autotransporter barrel domain protein [Elusimicrobium minutum Pei191]